MKDTLNDYYHIKVIGIIHITRKVFKIKTNKEFYIVKIVNNNQLENIFHNIYSLNIPHTIKIIPNQNNQYLTPYQNQYIYLMPYLNNDEYLPIEIKIKYYLNYIATIHNQTSYTIKTSQQYFNQLTNQIKNNIDKIYQYYQQLINNYEKIQWRSPTQWYYIMNYYQLEKTMNNAYMYLKQYQALTQNYKNIRVTYNYQNFDINHILIKDKCLISIDHINVNIPVFDLYYLYQNDFTLFDSQCLIDNYLNIVKLNQDEVVLLKCLLEISPLIHFNLQEIDNITLLFQLLHYIESVEYFIRQL
ncbi:MAG: hypothetical protein LUG60_14230 [Erysipelotrichaceae bacterium]|nr:hypothetical protein [Erysipelotrichaceae bacterium]